MTSSTRILIIDDDLILVETLKAYFAKRGVSQCEVAHDGTSAIQIYDRTHASLKLITCDLNMPDCDGIEFLTLLKERHCQVPIVVITSAMDFVSKSAEMLAKASGLTFLGVVRKPVNLEVLDETFEPLDL